VVLFVAAGVLFRSGFPAVGMKAILLTLSDIICVNLSGVGIFLLRRIRPRFFGEATGAKGMVRIVISIWVGLLALSVRGIYLNQRFITFPPIHGGRERQDDKRIEREVTDDCFHQGG
jgi:hypothetical protein